MIEQFINNRLIQGRAFFTREEALIALGGTSGALSAALNRQIKKNRLASPRQGFYLILRPEEQITGADPIRWIDPLMRFINVDYRISLLSAARLHGASHQAAMAFQLVTPQQLRPIILGRHRVEFVYQSPNSFNQVNQTPWVDSLKGDTGYSKAAGVELTLFDCTRYIHRSGGLNNVAQIVKDIGGKVAPKQLSKIAGYFENACIRRLGYLLDLAGHARQSQALLQFVQRAKNFSPLDPSVKPLESMMADSVPRSASWLLTINEPIEVDF